ncbi:MAG: DUF2178 domain-containing protein [Candidatus Paceibacterota bacterium]
MTKKTFLIYRIVTVIILSFVVSVSISYGNWYLPVISIITAWVFLYALRSRVKEVIADERDYRIAGKASIWAIKIYASISVIVGMFLFIAEKENEVLYAFGSGLVYSACFLMILYSVLFKIYEKKDGHD